MPQNNNNSSAPVPDLFDNFDPSAPQAPSTPQAQSPVLANVGGMYLPMNPAVLSKLQINPNADLQTLLHYMPEANAGPYASSPQGDAITSKLYQRQLNSPYLNSASQAIGIRHPLIASMLDSALAGASGAEQSHEEAMKAGGGYGAGFGAGLASLAAGMRALPEMQLARRQQLEQIPLGYEQSQAQLQQTQSGTLRNLTGALSEYESNPAKILSMYSRGEMSANTGAQSRENIAAMNDQERFNQALNSDATKKAIAAMQAHAKSANPAQLAGIKERFLNSLDSHIAQINARYGKLENTPVLDSTGLPRQRSADEIAQLETQRQQEIEQEFGYAEHASQQVFGRGLTGIMPQTQPQPTNPAPSSRANKNVQPDTPPANLLKKGVVSHFRNGQSWTLRNGRPVRVN